MSARVPGSEAISHQVSPASSASAPHKSKIARQSPSNSGINQAWVSVSEATPPTAGPVM